MTGLSALSTSNTAIETTVDFWTSRKWSLLQFGGGGSVVTSFLTLTAVPPLPMALPLSMCPTALPVCPLAVLCCVVLCCAVLCCVLLCCVVLCCVVLCCVVLCCVVLCCVVLCCVVLCCVVEWSGVEWSGVEWSGVECYAVLFCAVLCCVVSPRLPLYQDIVQKYFTQASVRHGLPLLTHSLQLLCNLTTHTMHTQAAKTGSHVHDQLLVLLSDLLYVSGRYAPWRRPRAPLQGRGGQVRNALRARRVLIAGAVRARGSCCGKGFFFRGRE